MTSLRAIETRCRLPRLWKFRGFDATARGEFRFLTVRSQCRDWRARPISSDNDLTRTSAILSEGGMYSNQTRAMSQNMLGTDTFCTSLLVSSQLAEDSGMISILTSRNGSGRARS